MADAGVYDTNSGHHPSSTTLIISNDEINDIINVAKSLEDSSLLFKGITVQNQVKYKKDDFLACF